MEIKECKSTNIIRDEIKKLLIEISIKVCGNYKKELHVYSDWCSDYYLGEVDINQIKIFGKVIFEDIQYKNILQVSFPDRKLEVKIIDQFLYPIVKEEFIKFVEENKDSIKSMCIIKNY